MMFPFPVSKPNFMETTCACSSFCAGAKGLSVLNIEYYEQSPILLDQYA